MPASVQTHLTSALIRGPYSRELVGRRAGLPDNGSAYITRRLLCFLRAALPRFYWDILVRLRALAG